MLTTPEGYYNAAIQRYKEATFLYRGLAEKGETADTYAAGAIYLVGVAAECLYRAFVLRVNPTARITPHNLKALADERFVKEVAEERNYDTICKANGFIYEAWSNEHRYRDNKTLKSFGNYALDKPSPMF